MTINPSKMKSAELLHLTKDRIKIVDGVATIDNKAIQEEGFAALGTDSATVKHSYDAVALLVNTVAEAFVEQSQDYLATNKDFKTVTAKTNIGEEELHLTDYRDSTSRNPKTGEISEHKGALTVRRVIKNRAGELTNIKQLAKETGLKKL